MNPRSNTTTAVTLLALLAASRIAYPAEAPEDVDWTRQFNVAAALQNHGLFELAIPRWEQIVEDCPDEKRVKQATYYVAICHFREKGFAESADHLKNLLKRFPKTAHRKGALLLLVACQTRLKREAEAAATLAAIRAEFPEAKELAVKVERGESPLVPLDVRSSVLTEAVPTSDSLTAAGETVNVTKAASTSVGLMAAGATVKKLADGFLFTEGPACDAEGNVYFSDIPNERIHRWSVDGKLTTFRENSGRANGLYFDRGGNLLACEGGSRRVTSISRDGRVTVLAESYRGKKLNSPNDLWIDPRGGVYFTDPRYGNQDGLEQDGFYVYYLSPDRKPPVCVLDDLVKPNGVVGTADGKLLYVADAGDGETYVYDIQPDGSLTGRKVAASIGSDGMTLDEEGNLYLTRGAVHVYTPSGAKIAMIEVPEAPANVCFGGRDRRTLFITARRGLYAVSMNVRGQ